MTPNIQKIETLVRQLLVELGEDPKREGLVRTPLRVAQALSFLTNGYPLAGYDYTPFGDNLRINIAGLGNDLVARS